MFDLLRELRLSFRRLALQPTFTFATILILAVGIGCNAAIFGLVNSVLLGVMAALSLSGIALQATVLPARKVRRTIPASVLRGGE